MCFQGIHSCLFPVEIPDLKPSMPSEFQCYKYPPCLRISRSKNSPLPPKFRKAIRGMVLGIFWNCLILYPLSRAANIRRGSLDNV